MLLTEMVSPILAENGSAANALRVAHFRTDEVGLKV
jgi:hypothetical protein